MRLPLANAPLSIFVKKKSRVKISVPKTFELNTQILCYSILTERSIRDNGLSLQTNI